MINVSLRFYGDLNQLIYARHNGQGFERCLPGPTAVKDLIEGCGVPHTEVDLILAKDEPVDFSYLIKEGDHISIYPVFTALDIPNAHRLQEPKLCEPRFVADVNLGKLAR